MSAGQPLPRRFGEHLLTASLGQDALGSVFRALRLSPERLFVRLRVLESAEIHEDAVLDAIEANGEIHSFLKNPAIVRGVQMDAVDGVPFIAWNEPSGRTLDSLIRMVRQRGQPVPVEHALLIGEKIATALDHAYNTTIDGERTLHGLVWPGFVSISDDGEIRLAGFGLAPGIAGALTRPHIAREIGPYLAPEYLASGQIQKNSDVYSVGTLLFELLFGRLPRGTDPLADLRLVIREAPQLTPELSAVLRNCLAPGKERYQSNGELRRELGKILFSGPYAPSTFNLAFFLNSLFSAEIEAETRDRARELLLDSGTVGDIDEVEPAEPAFLAPHPGREPVARRLSLPAFGGAILVVAAVGAGVYVAVQRPTTGPPAGAKPAPATRHALPTPEPVAAVVPPVTPTPDGQWRDEVARRVAQELKKMEADIVRSRAGKAESVAEETRPAPTSIPATPGKPAALATPTAAASETAPAPTRAVENNRRRR